MSKAAVCSIVLPRTPTPATAAKGIIHSPSKVAASQTDRDALLTAIAKARAWITGVTEGCVGSFAEIANREGMVERHIRLVAPLAFVSARIIANIR